MDAIPLIDPPLQIMILADGRQLSWQEFGAPEGKPVLYFHGGGSTSLEGGIFHREAVERNLRLIATNRPGAGPSSLCPRRAVAAYSNDLRELLKLLRIQQFACLGESNGGLVTLAVAATLSTRVLGAVPINPTVPWFDPVARTVSSGRVAAGYLLMKYAPRLLVLLASGFGGTAYRRKLEAQPDVPGFNRRDLLGPPPGTEADIRDFQWRVWGQRPKAGLLAELKWAAADWGFDYYTIPVDLDFYCGVHDPQAPFALVLADRNPNARFHYFSFGHNGFSHPDARRRIFDCVAGYFAA